jgi:Arc/MetJ-type ribon-helix-helix transcriptional regulator
MATDSDLTSFTVSLPRTQKEYLQQQAVATGCSTPSEYVRRLIHADQKARAKEDLEAKLLEALDSPAREMTPEVWAQLKNRVRAGADQRPRAKPASSRLARPKAGRKDA